jgi:sugar phosphate isomerase/epimerase
VFVQPDTYWMLRAGQDPVAWMRRYADRVILLHQKDFPAGAPQPLNLYDGVVGEDQTITMQTFERVLEPRCFTEIGSGVLPIGDILAAAAELPKLEYVLLEQDHTALDELDSVALSRRTFSTRFDADWS